MAMFCSRRWKGDAHGSRDVIAPGILAGDLDSDLVTGYFRHRARERHRVAREVRRSEFDLHIANRGIWTGPFRHVATDEPVARENIHEDIAQASGLGDSPKRGTEEEQGKPAQLAQL